jgi:acyl-CoA synthetase (AMP-forming)/AMP-acid ligase II
MIRPDPNPDSVLAALPRRLHHPVVSQALHSPHAVALVDSRGVWCFAELAQAVQHGADWLTKSGVHGGDRVLIVAENCREAAAMLLACSAIDAWAVMVNARLAAAEIEAIIQSCTPRLLCGVDASVQARAHAAQFGLMKAEIEGLGSIFAGSADAGSRPEPVFEDNAAQVAALIYTSGSSGEPKGVMLTHRNLLYMAAVSGAIRGLGSSDRLLGVLPISHIVGLSVVFLGALMHGAAVQLVMRFNPSSLFAALAKDPITIVLGAPAMLSLLLEYAASANMPVMAPHLRILSVSGAKLDQSLKQAAEVFFGLPVHHGYGITECGPTIAQIRPGAERPDCSVGPLLPGVDARLIGPDGEAVAPGDVGELLVRSPSVMLGYYNDPKQTAAVLDTDGWFHTGDLAKLDGTDLTVVGRAKDIIIRFGFNVYPAEVEAVLARHPSVLQAAVIGKPSAEGEEILAFVVTRAGFTQDFHALAQHAAQHLGSYKRPTRFFARDALPTTPTGKILKRALSEQAASATHQTETV